MIETRNSVYQYCRYCSRQQYHPNSYEHKLLSSIVWFRHTLVLHCSLPLAKNNLLKPTSVYPFTLNIAAKRNTLKSSEIVGWNIIFSVISRHLLRLKRTSILCHRHHKIQQPLHHRRHLLRQPQRSSQLWQLPRLL